MEFTVRDLAQFGAIAISLVGAFVTARIQIKQLLEKMVSHDSHFLTMDHRLDEAESARAVLDSKVAILSEISSVKNLESHNREMAELSVKVEMLDKEISGLRHMHNSKHPRVED